MDAAPPPVPVAPAPTPGSNPVLSAWPRSAQWVTAFLLGMASTLLAVQVCQHSRWGTRPTELARHTGWSYRIDLNQAQRAELLQLPGVGESLATRIQEYRREHGPFRSVDELVQVRGIGPVMLERLRPSVRVQTEAAEEEPRLPVAALERSRSSAKNPAPAASKTRGDKKTASLTAPIDINRAGPEELQRLPGIGPKMSQRILDERLKGPFKTVEELRRVSGIGPKTMERLRPYLTVDSDALRVVTTKEP